MTSLDPGSGCAIIAAATARKVRTIDYDRLNTGCKGANYYVSFNNPVVGRLMGQGVKAAMTAKGLLGAGQEAGHRVPQRRPDGQQLEAVQGPGLRGRPRSAHQERQGDQGPGPGRAGLGQPEGAHDLRADARRRPSNKIDAVAAANDGLANAVVTALKAKKLKPIPLSGQDATAQGAQNIISGWQSGTVYKPAKIEAPAAAARRGRPDQGRLSRRSTARRTTACATCRRSSRPRSGSRRRTSTCSTRTDSSRSPRCASARTSSTARTS